MGEQRDEHTFTQHLPEVRRSARGWPASEELRLREGWDRPHVTQAIDVGTKVRSSLADPKAQLLPHGVPGLTCVSPQSPGSPLSQATLGESRDDNGIERLLCA